MPIKFIHKFFSFNLSINNYNNINNKVNVNNIKNNNKNNMRINK